MCRDNKMYCDKSMMHYDKSTQCHIQSSMSRTGKSPTYKSEGRTNVAYFAAASKYLTPLMHPLLSPYGSSSLTPTKQPTPKSMIFPTYQIDPRGPLDNLHLAWSGIDAANSVYCSGSTYCFSLELTLRRSGFFRSSYFFHFLKFQGRLLQSSQLITYFSTPQQLYISLWMLDGFKSMTQSYMLSLAPQNPRIFRSSSNSLKRFPFKSRNCNLMYGTSEPYLFSIFSLMERMVWWRSNLAQMIFMEEIL